MYISLEANGESLRICGPMVDVILDLLGVMCTRMYVFAMYA